MRALPSAWAGSKFPSMLECRQRNLGGRASNRALRGGVFLAGLALAAFSVLSQLGRLSQLGWLMALPVAGAAYLLISGALGICVYNSMQGKRHVDHGREAILDPEHRAHLRNLALIAVSVSVAIGFGFAAAFLARS